jgi:hypothetical protein
MILESEEEKAREGEIDSEFLKKSTSARVQEYDQWIKQNKEKKKNLGKRKLGFKELLKQKEKFLEKKHNEQQEEYYHEKSIDEANMAVNKSGDFSMYRTKKNTYTSEKKLFDTYKSD